MSEHLIITISREYGSGGREVGQQLAKELGIGYSDKEAVIAAAKDVGVDPERFQNADESVKGSLLYTLAMRVYTSANKTPSTAQFSVNDQLYNIQAGIIREMAERGPCVFVGGCADYIVRSYPKAFHVFLHAPAKVRAQRLTEVYGADPQGIVGRLEKADRQRSYFCNYHSGRRFGQAQNYHLTLDTSGLTADAVVGLIKAGLAARGLLPDGVE